MSDRVMVQQIDRYLKGDLTEHEVDQLWEEFLREPKYLQWLEIETAARNYFLRGENGGSRFETTEMNSGGLFFGNTTRFDWICGVAALFLGFILFQWAGEKLPGAADAVLQISPREMSTVDVYRSVEEGYDPRDIEINRGFEAAMSGRTEESAGIFSNLLKENLTDEQLAAASLNSGILHYNRSNYKEASEAFRTVVRTDDLPAYVKEKSWWFMSQANLWMEEYEDALEAARRAHTYDGIYSDDAGRMITILEERVDE